MNTLTFKSRVQGCFLGVAIGDAMGMPVETIKHEDILKATKGKGISGFVDPVIRKEWLKDLKAGDTTDDWQLTRAVARSLIRTKGWFEAADCAQEHVRELDRSLFGWGKTTQAAIEGIKAGIRKPHERLDPPPLGKGCGNGVVMKAAPLAVAAHILQRSPRSLFLDTWALGSITHPDKRAIIAAYPVASFIQEILENGPLGTMTGRRHLDNVIKQIKGIEGEKHALWYCDHKSVSGMLSKIESGLGSAEALRTNVGCGFRAHETAAFAIGTFLRHPADFRTGVLEAVNAGGDTDTNASVVGALIGANVGTSGIPDEWKNFSSNFQEPLRIAEDLCSII